MIHIDDTGMPLGDNLGETDSCGKTYDYTFGHIGGLRSFGRKYFDENRLTGYAGGAELKYQMNTGTPRLAQYLVFEVYEDRAVFHIRNAGTLELYRKDDKLKKYTVYFVR